MKTHQPPLRIFLILLATALLSNAGGFSRVIIDPGHGGKDRGAVWGGIRESDLNLNVAKKVETILRARGVPVTMTRRSDQFVSLASRAYISNRHRNAIFVSIHFNASRHTYVTGAETYYASAKGRLIAQSIQKRLVTKLRVKDRKVRLGRQLGVLNKTNATAVLVECGYISNSAERKRCNTSWYQSLCARAIADGILAHR